MTSTIGLAGCLSSLTGGGASQVEEWLVDPRNLAGAPDQYPVMSLSPSTLDEYSTSFSRDDWGRIRDSFEYDFTRFYADELDRVTTGGWSDGFNVIVGDIDAEELDDDLRQEGLRSRGEYDGFELYEHSDERWAAGVIDGTVVIAHDRREENPVVVVEDIIDTNNGERRDYRDVDADFDLLMDEASIGDLFFAMVEEPTDETEPERGRFRNHVGIANTVTLGEDDSTAELVLTFLDERDPRERDIEDWTREADVFRFWRDIEIEIDEEVARIEGEVPTRDLLDVSFL
ncbi:hypothetical protein [Natronobeatus ordinarius]|uniref:hypothetical protein n=1 Tax=Natronobeatus ordinarius TaxID=2963433 RepID=UPI0020CC4D1A|nr:hypothetical protein [Natronobeatus ordinarius]